MCNLKKVTRSLFNSVSMETQVLTFCAILIIFVNVQWSESRKLKRQNYYAQQDYLDFVPHRPLRQKEKEEQQDFSKIPGVPGVDYPLYHEVPPTNFDCRQVPAVPGMYANVETGCQAYHVCHDGREGPQGASFLCTNGTIFNQKEFTCDWWYNVNCNESPYFYSLNSDPLKNPYAPKPKQPEFEPHGQYQLGAIPNYFHKK